MEQFCEKCDTSISRNPPPAVRSEFFSSLVICTTSPTRSWLSRNVLLSCRIFLANYSKSFIWSTVSHKSPGGSTDSQSDIHWAAAVRVLQWMANLSFLRISVWFPRQNFALAGPPIILICKYSFNAGIFKVSLLWLKLTHWKFQNIFCRRACLGLLQPDLVRWSLVIILGYFLTSISGNL